MGREYFIKGGIIMKLSRDVLSKSIISYAEVKVERNKVPIIVTDPIPYVSKWDLSLVSEYPAPKIKTMCWSPDLKKFCAISDDTWRDPTNYSVSYLSSDGKTWTKYDGIHLNNTESFSCITWSSKLKKFCAIGKQNSKIGLSSNGIDWDIKTNNLFGTDIYDSIVWSPELETFCTTSYTDGTTTAFALLSKDGETWTKHSLPPLGNDERRIICWSPELGIFCMTSYGGFLTSSDGKNWEAHPVQFGPYGASISLDWSPDLGIFCGVQYGEKNVWTSPDGITWTRHSFPAEIEVTGVTWSPILKIFLVCGYQTYNSMYASKDGINWTELWDLENIPIGYRSVSMIWSNDLGIYCLPIVDENSGSQNIITSVPTVA